MVLGMVTRGSFGYGFGNSRIDIEAALQNLQDKEEKRRDRCLWYDIGQI